MRLVDADALRENSKMLYSVHAFEPVEAYTQDQIDNAPTVEAAPVVHSEWLRSGSGWMCKSCGYQTEESTVNMVLHNYCPNCAAKMDL